MTDPIERGPSTLDSDGGRRSKRRKVRKGTQSCWECKRRKARCSLSRSRGQTVCDGCRRRGTRCIGQEYDDDPLSNKQQLSDRLGRVEELLVKIGGGGRENNDTPHPSADGFTDGSRLEERVGSNRPRTTNKSDSLSRPAQPAVLETAEPDKLTAISSILMTAWPSSEDLDIISSTPMSSYCVTFGLTFIPYAEALARPWPTPRDLLCRPDPRAHPVQIARQLLSLALLIRSLASEALQDLSRRLTTNATEIMALAFETATRYVTTNGELSGTIEAIECIMMEAMFQNNSGQIRLAFMACRRALIAGQMLGLDRGPKSPLIRLLDPATLHRIHPDYMWLRLVQMDTYLSMQLGLPQGAAENTFTTDAAALPPFERLERSLAIAGGRIIRRNCTARDDIELTREIDEMISENYSIMPPQWWLCPDLASPGHDELTLLRETNRFVVQITHFHMLEQLHLPFLLRPSGSIYDYHKITGVSASREVLTRYVAFRSAMPPTATFCRGIDFLAFSASTVLCLGHMDARLRQSCPKEGEAGHENISAVSKYLAHHRSSDRGIMERTLACLEASARERPSDPISKKVSLGLRHLLAVEADVANGMAYKVEPAYRDDDERDELGWRGKLHAEQDMLQVHIPHLGSIKIKPHGRAATVAGAQEPALQDVSDPALPTLDAPNRGYDTSVEGQLQDSLISSNFKGASFDVGVPDTGCDFRFNLDDFQEEQWFMPTFMFGDDWVRPYY